MFKLLKCEILWFNNFTFNRSEYYRVVFEVCIYRGSDALCQKISAQHEKVSSRVGEFVSSKVEDSFRKKYFLPVQKTFFLIIHKKYLLPIRENKYSRTINATDEDYLYKKTFCLRRLILGSPPKQNDSILTLYKKTACLKRTLFAPSGEWSS